MSIAGCYPTWGRFPNLLYFRQVGKLAVFQAGWETCPTFMNNPG